MKSQYNEIETVIILPALHNMKSFKKHGELYRQSVRSTVWCLFSNNEIPAENL